MWICAGYRLNNNVFDVQCRNMGNSEILSKKSVENDDFSNSGETERQENVCSIDRCSKCNIYKGKLLQQPWLHRCW